MLVNSSGASRANLGENYDLLEKLLQVDPGWATDVEISWNISDDDVAARRRVRQFLSVLGRLGVLPRMFVRHNGEPLGCLNIDHAAIRAAMGDDQ
jgi:hypothetical protein